jgi:hypothetical protein
MFSLDFTTLFVHCSTLALANDAVRETLVRALPMITAVDIERAVRLVDHKLISTEPNDSNTLLDLLAAFVSKVQSLAPSLLQDVKPFLFNLPGLQRVCRSTLSPPARSALLRLVTQAIDARQDTDRALILDFAEHWTSVLSSELQGLSDDQAGHFYTRIVFILINI